MRAPRLLDLFCGAGGAAMGYARAGFEVVGVDLHPQPHYPFEFHRADALTFPLDGFDVIHASPPCQAFTRAQQIRGRAHPELVDPIRQRLLAANVPYCIENVEGAPLRTPVLLCGTMFGLQTYRHRLFETSWAAHAPAHPTHVARQAKLGRVPASGEFIQVIGNFSQVAFARQAMGISWMTRDELRESIPPTYTEFLGRQLLAALTEQAVA